jgi:uncharacterized protein
MEPAQGKVLISGASGLLGAAIRSELARREMELLKLARAPRAAHPSGSAPRSNGAQGSSTFRTVAVSLSGEVAWDYAADPPVLHPELLEGLTAAIHLSGANLAARRWTPAYKKEIVSSRVDSTRALARTLAALRNPPSTLLVASAVGIYGDRGDELLDESSPAGAGFIADLCRQWEDAARPAAEAGIRVVHLRFGVVLGRGPSAIARMIPIFRRGLGGRLGSGRQWMSWISLDDAVSAVFFLLERPSLGGAFNFTSPNPVTNAGYTHALAARLHRPALLPAPAFALRLALGEIANEALLSSARVLPARLTAAGFAFAHPSLDDALAVALPRR